MDDPLFRKALYSCGFFKRFLQLNSICSTMSSTCMMVHDGQSIWLMLSFFNSIWTEIIYDCINSLYERTVMCIILWNFASTYFFGKNHFITPKVFLHNESVICDLEVGWKCNAFVVPCCFCATADELFCLLRRFSLQFALGLLRCVNEILNLPLLLSAVLPTQWPLLEV